MSNINLVRKLKVNHFYLGIVKFEDGYDSKLGSNKKPRPVLIIDKFYDSKKQIAKFIVAPVYSVKSNELIDNKFQSKYKYHCYINNWYDSLNHHQIYNSKFKINQIQILTKKDFIYDINNGIYTFKTIAHNSPVNKTDLEKLNKTIIEYSLTKSNKNIFKDHTNLYMRRYEAKHTKLMTKNKTIEKENILTI